MTARRAAPRAACAIPLLTHAPDRAHLRPRAAPAAARRELSRAPRPASARRNAALQRRREHERAHPERRSPDERRAPRRLALRRAQRRGRPSTAGTRRSTAWRAGWRCACSRERAAASSCSSRARAALVFGQRDARSPLRAVLRVRSPRFYRQLLRGSVGLGESYVDGLWDCDDLVALTRIAALNVGTLDRLRRVVRARADPRAALGALAGAQHARARARAHRGALRPRQRAVLAVPGPDDDVLLRGLRAPAGDARGGVAGEARARLREARASDPSDHVLEIGTGWGGFASTPPSATAAA